MSYRKILILGGTGFIGSHVIAKLADSGCLLEVPTRRKSHAVHLLPLPDVDLVVEANIHDDETLDRLVCGKDAVINLVGILHGKRAAHGERYGSDFARAHVELPRRVVAACARHGVRRYLHMSALGADRNAPSMYLRSKADGEAAAFSNPDVHATVFRPSVVFGDQDHFLNLFASLQKFLPFMLLASPDARFQPVYVEDVAQAFVNALYDDTTIGKAFELVGPKVYTLRELVKLAGEFSGHRRPVIGLPETLSRVQAFFLEHMPGEPMMTRDNLDSMQVDSIARASMEDELGITPTPLESVAPYYLQGQRHPHSGVAAVHIKR
ncbi:complex I NDUFA9 subunit family protein [Noviherbaspirillum agri]